MSISITVDADTLDALDRAKDYADRFDDVLTAMRIFRLVSELRDMNRNLSRGSR